MGVSITSKLVCAATVALAALAATSVQADTVNVYTLNGAQCSGTGCGEPAGFSFGTVTTDLNDARTVLTYTFNLTTGLFHDPGIDATAAFDATGTVTSWSETSNNSLGSWTDVGPGEIGRAHV